MKRLTKGKSTAAPVQAPIVAEDYPTLSEFFSAYLHQDFRNTYGSPTKAAKNYISDASPEEVQTLRNEWQNFPQKARRPAASRNPSRRPQTRRRLAPRLRSRSNPTRRRIEIIDRASLHAAPRRSPSGATRHSTEAVGIHLQINCRGETQTIPRIGCSLLELLGCSHRVWRYGATVSTRPFQGRNTGSIPVSATNFSGNLSAVIEHNLNARIF